jgi:hypothetical protein
VRLPWWPRTVSGFEYRTASFLPPDLDVPAKFLPARAGVRARVSAHVERAARAPALQSRPAVLEVVALDHDAVRRLLPAPPSRTVALARLSSRRARERTRPVVLAGDAVPQPIQASLARLSPQSA